MSAFKFYNNLAQFTSERTECRITAGLRGGSALTPVLSSFYCVMFPSRSSWLSVWMSIWFESLCLNPILSVRLFQLLLQLWAPTLNCSIWYLYHFVGIYATLSWIFNLFHPSASELLVESPLEEERMADALCMPCVTWQASLHHLIDNSRISTFAHQWVP